MSVPCSPSISLMTVCAATTSSRPSLNGVGVVIIFSIFRGRSPTHCATTVSWRWGHRLAGPLCPLILHTTFHYIVYAVDQFRKKTGNSPAISGMRAQVGTSQPTCSRLDDFIQDVIA